MKTVCIVITHGFQVRNILYTQIFSRLKEHCRVVLLCPADDVPYVMSEFKDEKVSVEPLRKTSTRVEGLLAFIRRYILSNPARSKTINVFSMNMKDKNKPLYYLIRAANLVLGPFKALRSAWLTVESWFINGYEYCTVFERYRPDVVLTANYGTQSDEIRILRCAKRYGVKSISIVQSWDNLSSKGVMGARPDRLIVWNNIMKDEAIRLHDYTAGDIYIAGVPQFDIYAQGNLIRRKEDFCRDMGLDPEKKLILFGTITPMYFPHNIDIVKILVDAIQRGLFKYSCQIVIRLHPQAAESSVWGDRLSDYLEIEKEATFVRCDIPKLNKWISIFSPERSDGLHLAELLYHADVCLNPASTLTIDAAIMDTPVIGIGFDGYAHKCYEHSIRRWYDFTYYVPVVRAGGLTIAYTVEQMIDLINAYLEDRSLDREGRRKIVEMECYKVDGKSGERVARYILESMGVKSVG